VRAAREEVLGRIRSALGSGSVPPEIHRAYRRRGVHEPGAPALLDLLEERTLDYRAGFVRATPAPLPDVVAAVLGEGVARVVIPPELDRGWVRKVNGELVVDDPSLTPATLDTTDAVVTACSLAIAETGTLVLDGSAGQGRRAVTLLPDLHVCVVGAGQVVGTVPEAVARLDPRRAMTFISGPSATSDIELNRVEGVHGPRRVVVILVLPVDPDQPE
jgi:L-lactate dehydrogenase complex protein LldG